jgi:regulator of nonsense transcripts 2
MDKVDLNGDLILSAAGTDSEEEAIVVTREEEEIDPEDEADFEREYAKMMAESLDSRKHERKSTFDVPLPIRRKDVNISNELLPDETVNSSATPAGTMAFSLLTKRGNRQQVSLYRLLIRRRFANIMGPDQTRTVALPSDSTFAIAMKTQQAAEREEQQRIKNLVLNYDLRDGEDQDGDSALAPLLPNPNIHEHNAGLEKAAGMNYTRPDKSVNNRSGQRARKLQLSDVDWYDPKQIISQNENRRSPAPPNTSPEGPDKPSAPPISFAGQQRVRRPARATAQVGRLTRKAMLQEHSSRQAGAKGDGKK